MKSKLLALVLLLPALAFGVTHVNNVQIKSVYCGYPDTYDMCSVEFESTVTFLEPNPCHTITTAKRMQFKTNTDTGKALLSMALTAFVAKKNVDVYSNGKCDIYTGLSDVNYIVIKD